MSLGGVAAVWCTPRWARPYDRPFRNHPSGRPCMPSLSHSTAAHMYMTRPRRCASLSSPVLPVSLASMVVAWRPPQACPYGRPATVLSGRPSRAVKAVVRSRFMPLWTAHCGEGHEAGVGKGHTFPCCPFHAHACAYLPENIRGRGFALVGGCDGGDVADDRPQFPLVGLGWAPPPSLLSGLCLLTLLTLLTLLCGRNVRASGEREHP